MSRRDKIIVSLFLVGTAAMTARFFFARRQAHVPSALPASVASQADPDPSAPGSGDDERSFVAVALPEQAVDLVAQTTAIVTEVLAIGVAAHAGDVVVRLEAEDVNRDDAEANAAAKQASAELHRAQAQLRNARQRLELRRTDGVVSLDEKQSAEIAVQVAVAEVEVARQHVVQNAARHGKARFHVEQLAVRAPFDGVVAARYQVKGSSVTPGAKLVRFIGARLPLVRFAVPQSRAHRLRVGDRLVFRQERSAEPVAGTLLVSRIAPEADPNSGLVIVEAAYRETNAPLAPGMVGRVELN